MDVFPMWVEHVGDDRLAEPELSRVTTMAWTTNEATLIALEMVAARGRTPVSLVIDWDAFG